MGAIFEQYPAASWKVGSFESWFPVIAITEEYEKRIVQRDRPFRDGAKLDDVGRRARRWQIQILFNNTIDEDGLANNGVTLYPEVLRRFIESADQRDTGDLTLPTVGKVRAKLERYTRIESPDDDDSAKLSVTFIEDSEDAIGAINFAPPSVKASAIRLTEQAVFSAEADGAFDFNISQLNEWASAVETAINAPGQSAQEVDQTVGAAVAAIERVLDAFSTSVEGRDTLTDADSSQTQRKLASLSDTFSRAKSESKITRTVRILVERDTTLYSVAIEVKQPAETLIGLNPDLDPTFVEAGSFVRIFDL